MVDFKLAINTKDFKIISELAKVIWTEHYTPIIGTDQVNYMLKKFQSEKAIKNQIANNGYKYFIICNTNSPIGYLSIKKEKASLFLSKIYIDKANRGKGIGKVAMRFIIEQAISLNCKKIYLTVNKYNTNSIMAYQKIGFKIIEELVIDIGNGFIMDDYKMEKSI
ncbi:MAG: GNAT family N-acetyltransferase [Flavobacteriaceae bacterium]|nr:GNAT family N-acetyltransferase [Flavobacteriaceae bacterium]